MWTRSSAASRSSTRTRCSRSRSRPTSPPKLILGAALVLASAVPAAATEWFTCHNAEAAVELGLLMGGDEALGPVAATLGVASAFYSTDPAYGDGTPITLAQSYFGSDLIQVDLRDGDVNEQVARIRLVSAETDGEAVRAGTLEVFGTGAWPVVCGAQ